QGQHCERREIEAGVAPLHEAYGLETVAFEALHQFLLERCAAAGRAERAVAQMATGAAGDLSELRRIETAELEAVELAVARERDVIDVEIEPHADGVGGDEIFDVAVLIELDLRVARARRQRAENDGRAAALAADQFG